MDENNCAYWSEFADKDEQARIHDEWTSSANDAEFDSNELAALLMTDCDVANYPEERVEEYIQSLQEYVNPNQGNHDENDKEHKLIRSLIRQCARAAAVNDTKTAYSLVKDLRLRGSPKGNRNERLAHHFAEALVARITDTGSLLCKALSSSHFTTKEFFAAFQVAIQVTPLSGLPIFFTNQTILEEAANAESIHVISYGIGHGFMYLCLIKDLSQRPGGPPKLRLTGLEFPNHHFYVPKEDFGSKLISYAKQVGVSLEFNCLISEDWHNIEPSKLKIHNNEALFVVSIYRLRQIYDETDMECTPRKQLLANIHSMKPAIFIEASYTASCNSPSLVSRAMEYFDYLSAVFDAFEETVPRDRIERQFMEMIHGLDLLYNLGCEGVDRKERPENLKHWRNLLERAGFKQKELRCHVYMKSKEMVGTYHRNFKLTRDGNSMLISWKNRLLGAITAWEVQ